MNLKAQLTIARLRWVIAGVFLAILVPTLVLAYHAYGQLQFEAFHRARVQAEELTRRIDLDLRQLVAAEEARSFTDYGFLVVEGDTADNFVQRSPLSGIPAESPVAGLRAYFQVDGGGKLTTPLVPESSNAAKTYGVGEDEYRQRLDIEGQVRDVLKEKQLGDARDFADALDDGAGAGRALTRSRVFLEERESALAEEVASVAAPSSSVDLGQVKKDLRRKEQNIAVAPDDAAEITITTFESEIGGFEFNRLDEDHFVLYRRVWRDEQRYVQGALITRQAFLESNLAQPFLATGLAAIADLVVSYGAEVLASYRGSGEYGPQAELVGSRLYQTRLAAPFDGIALTYDVRNLPLGAGASVVTWTAAVLLLVLLVGFTALYRLGLKQIALARQQQDFVSAVSHELKTPLTSIRMYGEILKAGWTDEAKRQSYYEFIFEESERLSRLIDNVLQLSRLTRNKSTLDLQDTTVAELIDLTLSRVSVSVESAGFELEIGAIVDAHVRVDTDAFVQVMINLVDNACKFAKDAADKTIRIDTREQSGTVIVSVRDFGPGLPPDQLQKIFELFYRAENELTRETAGTGIGLALVRELTARMAGAVDVVNRDPGAEFRIIVPAVDL